MAMADGPWPKMASSENVGRVLKVARRVSTAVQEPSWQYLSVCAATIELVPSCNVCRTHCESDLAGSCLIEQCRHVSHATDQGNVDLVHMHPVAVLWGRLLALQCHGNITMQRQIPNFNLNALKYW